MIQISRLTAYAVMALSLFAAYLLLSSPSKGQSTDRLAQNWTYQSGRTSSHWDRSGPNNSQFGWSTNRHKNRAEPTPFPGRPNSNSWTPYGIQNNAQACLSQNELKQLSNDLEQYANCLAVYFITPGRPIPQGQEDLRLVQELNIMREHVNSMISINSRYQSYGYWQVQLRDLKLRAARMSALANAGANNAIVWQKWWKVQTAINRLGITVNW